jgi:Ca2+-binding EF-hand superfamily protein
MLNTKDIENLRREFEKIDTDNSGTIEAKELEKAIKNANVNITDEEI